MSRSTTVLLASVLVASGILTGTLAAALTESAGPLVLTGPVILAASVYGAAHVLRDLRPGIVRTGWILAGAVLLAGILVAWRDTTLVASTVAITGAGVGSVFLVKEGRPQAS